MDSDRVRDERAAAELDVLVARYTPRRIDRSLDAVVAELAAAVRNRCTAV